jgi:hypothetical protein
MNFFTSTTLNYDLVQDRRHSFEQAAARRRLLRFTNRSHPAPGPTVRRPPDPPHVAVYALVDANHSGTQHLPAAPVSEPTTARVA